MPTTYACALPPLAQLGAYLLLILVSGLAGYAAARAANARDVQRAQARGRSDGYHDAIRDRIRHIETRISDPEAQAPPTKVVPPPPENPPVDCIGAPKRKRPRLVASQSWYEP